jgi:hypothetical protein
MATSPTWQRPCCVNAHPGGRPCQSRVRRVVVLLTCLGQRCDVTARWSGAQRCPARDRGPFFPPPVFGHLWSGLSRRCQRGADRPFGMMFLIVRTDGGCPGIRFPFDFGRADDAAMDAITVHPEEIAEYRLVPWTPRSARTATHPGSVRSKARSGCRRSRCRRRVRRAGTPPRPAGPPQRR